MTQMRRRERFASAREVAQLLRPSYPVFCVRPHVIERAARHFIELFPGKTMYAVKCNPHPMVLRALYAGGIRAFDTASLAEIAQVAETWEDAGAYFMHPVKPRGVIATAWRVYGVEVYALDHVDELDKLCAQLRGVPEITAVVRLKTEEAGTLFHLSEKFGAEYDEAVELLREIPRRGMKPGVAFHVGSQCLAPRAYHDALRLVGDVLAAAEITPVCIDVGGGFPAPYLNVDAPALEDFMTAIEDALAELALPSQCEVLAEPGRALVAEGSSLLVQVQLRKGERLYINDGIYGGLSEMVAAGIKLPAQLIRLDGAPSEHMRIFTLAGPTCDSLDIIPDALRLPVDVREGDWIEIDRVGAYSNALASRFNGFFPDVFVEVIDEPPGAP